MMNPTKIKDISEYHSLVSHFGVKGCLTNDYLHNEALSIIKEGKIYKIEGRENALLLVEKDGFFRLYFYVNNPSENLALPEGVVSTEILYRSVAGEPEEIVSFLEKNGFKRHLTRQQYSGVYKNLNLNNVKDCAQIELAENIGDIEWAFNLFNKVFDKYTGDYNSPDVYPLILERKELIIAKADGQSLGALHLTKDGVVTWLSHVAVSENARGKNIGYALVDYFIRNNMISEKSRYMLWVQQQNLPAVSLYKKIGFIPTGKSSLSMIKF